MKLAIIGSTEDKFTDLEKTLVKRIVKAVCLTFMPDEVVSGGATGVDTWAAEESASLKGVSTTIFRPEKKGWYWYKKRNQKIADECTALVRIVSKRSKTYGSGWTRDRAKEQGKPTWEITIG